VKPKLIGLYSPAPQSGKSTVAEYLCRKHGYQQIAFAGPLKEMTETFLICMGVPPGLSVRMVYGDLKESPIEEIGCTPRHLMQTLGTEWGRNCVHTELWVKVALARAAAAQRPVVIDDMRFPNEMEAVRAAGGVCLQIVRPGVERKTSHPSEGQLDNARFDCTLVNSGSEDDLYAAIDRCFL
jgi:hypothetical protein